MKALLKGNQQETLFLVSNEYIEIVCRMRQTSMNLILLGPPGAGKGTQAETLVKETGLAHISSGDLFRAALRDKTELGMRAKGYMDKGDLVPDDVVIGMILERVAQPDCAKGVIFDGFPRTVDQAEALKNALAKKNTCIDAVISIGVPQDMLIKRISGRRTCKSCGAIFNTFFFPPAQEGVCDKCGGELYQRSDDTEETAQNRLDVYFKQTTPLIEIIVQKAHCTN
jgi:adenylate kinase